VAVTAIMMGKSRLSRIEDFVFGNVNRGAKLKETRRNEVNNFSLCDITTVPDRYQLILTRIQSLFDSDILICSCDEEWLNFRVLGRSDRSNIVVMEVNKAFIFPGNAANKYQILCPWSSADKSGLWIHYMASPATRQEHCCGCWFY
jgi:hypothetical protein